MSQIRDNLYDCILECSRNFSKLPDFRNKSGILAKYANNTNLVTATALLRRIDEIFLIDIIQNNNLNSISDNAKEVLTCLTIIHEKFNVNDGVLNLAGKGELNANDYERIALLNYSNFEIETIRTQIWKLINILEKKPELLKELFQ